MKYTVTKKVLIRKRIISQVLGEDGNPKMMSHLSYFLRGKDAEQLRDVSAIAQRLAASMGPSVHMADKQGSVCVVSNELAVQMILEGTHTVCPPEEAAAAGGAR